MNVPTEIESLLVSAIQYWLSETRLYNGQKDSDGNKLFGPVSVKRGFLPINMAGEVNPQLQKFFPHVIVQGSDFHYTFEEGAVSVKLMVGCWDDSEDFSGYQGVIQIMCKLTEALYFERILGDQFPLTGELTAKLVQGAELWPQFYGLMEIQFETYVPNSRFDGMVNQGGHESFVDLQPTVASGPPRLP